MDGLMDGWIGEFVGGWMDRWVDDRWMDGYGRKDKWMDGWMDSVITDSLLGCMEDICT